MELRERRAQLGGQLLAAAREVGGGEVFLRLIDHHRCQIERAGVAVKLSTDATGRTVAGSGAEVCIVATGAAVATHPVVAQTPAQVRVWQADDAAEPAAAGAVVVLGADRSALVAAEALAQAGSRVTLLGGGKAPAWDVAPTFKWRHFAGLEEFGIRVWRSASAEGWDPDGRLRLVWTGDRPSDAVDALDVELLVVGGERCSRQELVRELEYRVDVLHVVGDAVSPQSVCQAVHGAYRVAAHV